MTSHPGNSPTLLERALVVFVLFMSTSAYIPPFSAPVDNSDGDGLQLLRYAAYLVAIGLVVAFSRSTLHAATRAISILLLVSLAALSVAWSPFPDETATSALALIVLTLFGLFLAGRYTIEQLLGILAIVGMLMVASSYVYILLPNMDGVSSSGAWRGAFINKNTLGQRMVVVILVSIFLGLQDRKYRLQCLVLFALSVTLLLQSDSKTSLATLGSALLCALLLRNIASISGATGLVVVLAAVAFPIILLWLDEIVGAVAGPLGRDVTLTGRTELWEVLGDMVLKRPFLGYGYDAFWEGPNSPSAPLFSPWGWRPPDAHNGYLELALALGFLGLALFILSSWRAWSAAYLQARMSYTLAGAFPIAFLAFFFSHSLAESALMYPHIAWVLYVAVTGTRVTEASAIRGTHPSEPQTRRSPQVQSGIGPTWEHQWNRMDTGQDYCRSAR